MGRLMVGELAPEFALPSQSGRMVKLSDFRGDRCVVVYFYPRDFSRGCELEARTFASSYGSFRSLDAEILGVSSDTVETHRDFADRFRLPFPLLSDRENRVRRLYRVSATFGLIPGRVTYIVDREGFIRHMYSSQRASERHTREALNALARIVGRRPPEGAGGELESLRDDAS